MSNHKLSIKVLFFILCLAITNTLVAQNETANWFFGENAGLNFNNGFPNVELNSQIFTTEGCSTISDKQGQLLFYSDGRTVWNKNHEVMQNGTGLKGDDSSTQSAIIIPQPDSDSIYYIFTVDARAGVDGMQYSIIDITLNGGLGAVTNVKNVLLETPTTEKITAVESADGESIWIIGHRWGSNEFIAYLVSDTGLNTTPVVSATGSVHGGNTDNSIGYLKASPNREKVAAVKSYANNETQLFDFNANTGLLSNPITISNYDQNSVGPYGCEFSPDSRLLYISEIIGVDNNDNTSKIHQYDITLPTAAQVISSDFIIAEEDGQLGAIQQALDGKLYVAKFNQTAICVINEPNEIGATSNYQSEVIFLGGEISRLGLPPFIQSYFFATNVFNNTCFGDSTQFSIDTSTTVDSITWNFGDPTTGADNTSNSLAPNHVFSAPGTYNITITIIAEGETQLVFRSLTISTQPQVMDLDDLIVCESENEAINLINIIPDSILNNPDLSLSFYENEIDATNKQNGINSPSFYPAPDMNQEIYVRLENSLGSDCFSLSNFEIIINSTPDIEFVEDVFFCDDDNSNTTIDVGDLPLPFNNYEFLWLDSNETTPQITVDTPGTYTVRITESSTITTDNPEGCFADRVVNVSSSGPATIDNINTTGDSAIIYASGLGDYEYALDNENGVYQDSNIFENLEPGVHIVFIRDKNDCGTVQQSFSIIDFPVYFTPNGDLVNDYWQVKGVSSEFQPNSKIYIFDRYGKLITQIKASSRGWDGTLNGQPLPNSDYWFSVTLEDGRVFMDHFTLKR